jgi:hypothetical protein
MSNKKNNQVPLTPAQEIAGRVQQYVADNNKLLERHGMRSMIVINFPQRKRVPILSKIALWFVRKQGGILDMRFEIFNKK